MTSPATATDADVLAALTARVTGGESGEQAAAALGVSGRTIYRRAKTNPAFREQLTEAIKIRDDRKLLGHGTQACYRRGCRCPQCTAAACEHHARWVESIRGRPIPPTVQHGKEATYRTWGCRCDPCREAGRIANRAAHERRHARGGTPATKPARSTTSISRRALPTIEQAIARGWPTSRIMAELGVCYEGHRSSTRW